MSFEYDINQYENLSTHLDHHLDAIAARIEGMKYFAIVILPKSKDDDDEPEEDSQYFKVKEILVKRNIPSQFVLAKNIGTNNFSYSLSNIAIAILAKLGGIPWKLKREQFNELIIGFGERKIDGRRWVGNTVFFDNSGLIKGTRYFQEQDADQLVSSLKRAILNY